MIKIVSYFFMVLVLMKVLLVAYMLHICELDLEYGWKGFLHIPCAVFCH